MRKLLIITTIPFILMSCDDVGQQVNNNTSQCGNNILEFYEACDGNNTLIDTCESLGFQGGILQCASDCTYDTSNCTSECNVCEASSMRCSGDIIEVCSENENGCTFWETHTDCETSGLICAEVEGSFECIDDCTDSCTDGDTRCSGTVVQQCLYTPGQCAVWADMEDCSDSSQVCSTSSGPATCIDTNCTDQCTPGSANCQENTIYSCEYGANGCTDWVAGTVCQNPTPYCDDSDWPVVCVSCVDECTQIGETQCNGTFIATCSENASGCLEWIDGENCADTGTFCDDAVGPAECTTNCTNQCTPQGSTRCDGNIVQTCTEATSGCNIWQYYENCDTTGAVCQESGLNASCVIVCNDECTTEGEMFCSGTSIMECMSDTNGCLYIDVNQNCTDSGSEYICSTANGYPECVYNCSNECSTEGDYWCTGTIIEECLSDSNGCLYVSSVEDCDDSNRLCHDDGSSVQCECIDECFVYGETWCDNDYVMECTTDYYGCNIIAESEDCLDYGSNYICEDTSGYTQCVYDCIHECDLGEGYCSFDDLYTCEEDYNGCRYFEYYYNCADYGQICVETGLTADCF
ncbi:hypothetical protein KKF34_00665 [Myxococcota bacterium]|nr:hypothetical protein [Myxococcota bacterium]MBU1495373.1 hypothetical protein [Myxococcota bacterium]